MQIKPVDKINVLQDDQRVVDQAVDETEVLVETARGLHPSIFALAAKKEIPSFSIPSRTFSTGLMPWEIYDWVNRGKDPKKVTDLVLHDGMFAEDWFKDQDIAFIAEHFTNLRSIKFLTGSLSDSSMKELKKLPQLTSVWLSNHSSSFTDAGLYELALAVPKLGTLVLERLWDSVTGSMLDKTLQALPHLRSLRISEGSIPWPVLENSLQKSSITHLEFDRFDTGTGPEAMKVWRETFSAMKNLQSISLEAQEGTHARTMLDSMSNIQKLNLYWTPIEPDQELPASLKCVKLDFTFEGAPLSVLVEKASRLPQLEVLAIGYWNQPANYENIDFAEHLANGFKALKEIRFDYPPEEVYGLIKRLKYLRPELKIYIDPYVNG